jgi:hypothetical protein
VLDSAAPEAPEAPIAGSMIEVAPHSAVLLACVLGAAPR